MRLVVLFEGVQERCRRAGSLDSETRLANVLIFGRFELRLLAIEVDIRARPEQKCVQVPSTLMSYFLRNART
jgi:hypothetical protein